MLGRLSMAWCVFGTPLLLLPSLRAQAPQICGTYQFDSAQNLCYFDAYYPWFAGGSGWQTLVSFANPQTATELASYQIKAFYPYNGTSGGPLWVKASLLGNSSIIIQTVSVALAPTQGYDLRIFDTCYSNNICEDDQPAGQGKRPQSGAIWVQVRAPSAATLDAQQINQLNYTFFPNGSPPTYQTTVPLWRSAQLASDWLTTITETATAQDRSNDPDAVVNAVAIFNASNQPQAVTLTIRDLTGTEISSMNTPVISPYGTAGFLLISSSPSDTSGLWPSSLALSSYPDGLFHGSLEFTSGGGGNIIPLVLRASGSSLASTIVTPVGQTSGVRQN